MPPFAFATVSTGSGFPFDWLLIACVALFVFSMGGFVGSLIARAPKRFDELAWARGFDAMDELNRAATDFTYRVNALAPILSGREAPQQAAMMDLELTVRRQADAVFQLGTVTRNIGVRKILNTIITEATNFQMALTEFSQGILEGRPESELQGIDAKAQRHLDAFNAARYRLSRKTGGNLHVLSRAWSLG
ncbi:hypothetical protein [Kocuria rosea]|uniref:hypothetical protein n=1 Tax=Kocuria rosea TaxID=1275 RepID=UPI0011A3E777|nr:hypothetical protein [Kocuria rosea]